MSARTIIAAFGSAGALAAALGVSRAAVHKWAQRDSIPAEHDLALVSAAAGRGVALTLEQLAAARADRARAAREAA